MPPKKAAKKGAAKGKAATNAESKASKTKAAAKAAANATPAEVPEAEQAPKAVITTSNPEKEVPVPAKEAAVASANTAPPQKAK